MIFVKTCQRIIKNLFFFLFFLQKTLEQLTLEEIDQSNAVLFIHYDPDTKMIYLAGKVSFIHIIVGYIHSCTGITAGSACRESCV